MAIKQLSIFVENKQGRLLDTVKVISDAGINIRAMSLADTQEFGILRVIVSDLDTTIKALEGHILTVNEVVAVKMDDNVGALTETLKILGFKGINIEYMYAFTASEEYGAYVVLRVDDVADAEKALTDAGHFVLGPDDVGKF